MSSRPPIFGLLAEFASAQALLTATHQAHEKGYRHMDAFSPFPVEGLAEALGFHKTRMPLLVLIGGILGAYVLTAIPAEKARPLVLAYLALIGIYLLWRGIRHEHRERKPRIVEPLGLARLWQIAKDRP